MLKPEDFTHIVAARWYVIDVNPRTVDVTNIGLSGFYGGSTVYSGEGAPDIARLQTKLAIWPKVTMLIDITKTGIAQFVPVTAAEVEQLRLMFIAAYGNVTPPEPVPPVVNPP